jgi:hypothetical protein
MNWHILSVVWDFIRAAGGMAVISASIYYGPKKVLETWDWYLHRFRDSAVFDVLDQRIPSTGPINAISVGKCCYPISAKEIAHKLSRTEPSVLKSLRRLKKGKWGDQVIESEFGWFSKDNAPKN